MDFQITPKATVSGGNPDSLVYTVKRSRKNDSLFSVSVKNTGQPLRISEIILLDMTNPFAADTPIYGEGFSMLAQYEGTVEQILPCTGFDDAKHYKLPKKSGMNVVYNMALFKPEPSQFILIGFASCRKFCGEIRFNSQRLEVVLITEDLLLEAGEIWTLEEFFIAESNDRERLLLVFAEKIQTNHQPPKRTSPPSGWCSWYCYGPNVTEQNIIDNLKKIKKLGLDLKYIQIDDGYEKHMGDWLIPADTFPDGIKPLFDKIRENGFEPAIWVAPFIAEKDSYVLQNHPDWFIHDEDGLPLASDSFTYGGWRRSPWYMVDATNPDAYEYIRHVFHTMRTQWGCKYFKLDANMWGAMHKGSHYNPNASKVEAYRLGMQAVREGAGSDSFLLGCNAPMWPTIGTVDGNRQTGDINRDFKTFKMLAGECFRRNWQHNRFWINDPDCATLESGYRTLEEHAGQQCLSHAVLTDDEYLYHATYIYASGGMVLSGDDFSQPNLKRITILKHLLAGDHQAARFDDEAFEVGRIALSDGLMLCLFNGSDRPREHIVPLDDTYTIKDIWHDRSLGEYTGVFRVTLPMHSGLLFECKRKK